MTNVLSYTPLSGKTFHFSRTHTLTHSLTMMNFCCNDWSLPLGKRACSSRRKEKLFGELTMALKLNCQHIFVYIIPSSNGSGIVPMSKPKRKSNLASFFVIVCSRDIFTLHTIHIIIVFMSEFEYLIHKLYLLDCVFLCSTTIYSHLQTVQRRRNQWNFHW